MTEINLIRFNETNNNIVYDNPKIIIFHLFSHYIYFIFHKKVILDICMVCNIFLNILI